MARLPDKFSLSGPASLRSGRPIASWDTSGQGRGIAAAGQDIASHGAEMLRQRDTVDLARAEAFKTEGLLKVQRDFDADPDYATFGRRAPEKTGEIVTNGAALIRNGAMRERWKASARADAARYNDAIFDRGTRLRKEAETVAFDEALETNRRIYVNPDTPEADRNKARADIEGAIGVGLSTGLLTPEAADTRRRVYLEGADLSRGELTAYRYPEIITGKLPSNVAERAGLAMGYFQKHGFTKEQAAGIVGNLLAESSLNTGARNAGDGRDGSDSIGIGQWNSTRARALMKFAGERGKDWRDFETQLAFVIHELDGSHKSIGDRLRAARDLKEATHAGIMFEGPAGSQNGPENAMHYDKRIRLAAQAAGETIKPDWYDRLSPEGQLKVDRVADARRNEIRVESRGVLETIVDNAPVAVQNTGSYSGSVPPREAFEAAYGEREGGERYDRFAASMAVADQVYGFRTMSTDEIMQAVDDATPVSSGNNAAMETKRHETLAAAAKQTIEARESDPASYTMRTFPSVAAAWDAAGNSPDGYSAALAMTAAAQQQLGIRNQRLLPKSVASPGVSAYANEDVPLDGRIAGLAQLILATPDQAQRQAIFDQLVEAGLPEMTEGAVEALARGDASAARRLFQAATVDPTKLPGKVGVSTDVINTRIQELVMAPGQIGDAVYGLSTGIPDNLDRAQRDDRLIFNAVQLRLRQGQELDVAINGAAKDIYGDQQVVSGDGNVNAIVTAPKDADPTVIRNGLTQLKPKVRAALEEQRARLLPSAAPKGDTPGLKAPGNIDLAARPVVTNADGSISTVRSMSFEEDDGTEVLVPTISPDGKALSDDEAISLYRKTGQHLGKFDTPEHATAYAERLHAAQEEFYTTRRSGLGELAGAGLEAATDNILAEGVFRNADGGYSFIDPYSGLAIGGPDGKPLVFTLDEVTKANADLAGAERAGAFIGGLVKPPSDKPRRAPTVDESGFFSRLYDTTSDLWRPIGEVGK
ncbi:phage tail tip lysozyme [Mesorhizobium yinganensis]|uniref:phage tail tip lysozyme n=1 Tax=Mesorhizobium yinganensis TaxID=3157707 RepID=UPI0032B87BD9